MLTVFTSLCVFSCRISPSPPPQFVLPEHGAHAFLTLLFLLGGQWIALALNLPLVAFNANKYVLFLLSRYAVTCMDVLTVPFTEYGIRRTCTTQQRSSARSRGTSRRRLSSLGFTCCRSSTTSIGASCRFAYFAMGCLFSFLQDDCSAHSRERVKLTLDSARLVLLRDLGRTF